MARALAPAGLALKFQREAQLRNPSRRLRPVAIGASAQSSQMIFIGKARHIVVGLGIERAMHEPPFGMNAKDGQVIARALSCAIRHAGERIDERGDKNGFAGARKARHAQSQ